MADDNKTWVKIIGEVRKMSEIKRSRFYSIVLILLLFVAPDVIRAVTEMIIVFK